MHSTALKLFVLLASAPVSWTQGDPEQVETKYASGALRERFEVVRDSSGAAAKHGEYTAWHENGEVAAEGKYEDGAKSGKWVYRYDNGKRESQGLHDGEGRRGKWKLYHPNGKKAGEGRFDGTFKTGEWKMWFDDGSVDSTLSGEYEVVRETYPSGALRCVGSTVDGARQGRWIFYWENDQPQFEGEYFQDRRTGPWVFHHADGTFDAEMLSGDYVDGRRGGRLPTPPASTTDPGDPIESAEGLFELYGLEVSPVDAEKVAREVEAALVADGTDAFEELLERGRKVTPALLAGLCALDMEDPAARGLAVAGYGHLLAGLAGGHTFDWDAGGLRLTVLRWLSLWSLTKDDAEFWELDLAYSPETVGVPTDRTLLDLPFPDGVGAVPFVSGDARQAFGLRFDQKLDPVVGNAVSEALAWLAKNQDPSGAWVMSSKHYQGCTGLALLCFLATGNTTSRGPYQNNVLRGVEYLLGAQQKSGLIGKGVHHDFIYEHAVATLALCEVAALSSSRTVRSGAQRAVDFIHEVRNSDGAWRYDVPPVGDSDTSITCWMVQVLVTAEWAQLYVDEEALRAARDWIVEMTNGDSGRIGYDTRGSVSARTAANVEYPRELGEAMTAAGLMAHLLLGGDRENDPMLKKHARLVLGNLPEWKDELGNDMYYWFYGSQAMSLMGGDSHDTWRSQFVRVAVGSQVRDGAHAGSWDPVGPWSYVGGRVYSTAMMTLALLAPVRLAEVVSAE